jgi:hypothetical protein
MIEPDEHQWIKINDRVYINLDGDNHDIHWSGISLGYSWCRGSRITINNDYGYLGKTKKNILDEYGNTDYRWDIHELAMTHPKELADILKISKKISAGCYIFNMEDDTYLLYLSSVSLDDLINELSSVHNFAESNGKELLWI